MIAALLLAAALPACLPAQLRVETGGPEADFNGMSHGGTYLIVRNTGRNACRTEPKPTVSFRDARGRVLPVRRSGPAGLRPAGAQQVTIPAGSMVRAGLRWVSGPVYARSRCIDAASVTVAIGSGSLKRAPVRARLCGEAGQAIAFQQSALEAPSPRP